MLEKNNFFSQKYHFFFMKTFHSLKMSLSIPDKGK